MPIEVHKIKVQEDVIINYCYILVDAETRKAALVDPAWEIDKISAVIEREYLNVAAIFITHVHFDHINLAVPLAETHNVPIYIHELDLKRFPNSPTVDLINMCDFPAIWVSDTNIYCLPLGKEEVFALHTPGHTKGSVCFYTGTDLIAGDTLFIEGCGVCDGKNGDAESMFWSLQFLNRFIPHETKIYPGHCYGIEPGAPYSLVLKKNIYLHIHDIEKFIAVRMRKLKKGIFDFK